MAANHRFSHLLDGVGALFAPKPTSRERYSSSYDADAYRTRDARRRPHRRNTCDSHHHGHDPRRYSVDAPDIDHLRQARAEYYDRPPDDRTRRPSAPAAAPPSRGPRAVQAADMDPRLARTVSTRKSTKGSKPSRKERSEDRDSAVYVYSSTPHSGGSRRSRRDEDDGRSRAGGGGGGGGAHRRTVSSPAANVIDVEVEVEKEPESPVRREDGVRLSRTVSARDSNRPVMTRPSLRRTGTLKSPSIADAHPTTPSQRRNSGLFGLFRHMPPPAQTPEKKYDCMVCMDEVRASRCPRLSCGHRMCHACLKRQFELSVRDPQHMPPRCCTTAHIPLKHVERLFDTAFKIRWNKKYQEYTAKNRVYCPTRGCGEWIKPANIRMDYTVGRKVGKCPRCRGKVCVECNGRWHPRRKECPRGDDDEAQAFAEMAKESGWQRCYNCKAMVELKEGCNHMTCRCTAQFCMLCGAKWKSCECPWFNYAHLDDDDRLRDMRVPEPYVVVERNTRDAAPLPRPPPNARPDDYAVPAPRQNHPVYVHEDRLPRAPASRAASVRTRGTRTYVDRERERELEREREDEMLARRLQSEFFADIAGNANNPYTTGRSRSGGDSSHHHRRHSHHHHDDHRHHHHRRHSAAAPSRYDSHSPEIEVEVMGLGNAAGHHMNDFGLRTTVQPQRQQRQQEPPRTRATLLRRSNTTRSAAATHGRAAEGDAGLPRGPTTAYAAQPQLQTQTQTQQYQYQYGRRAAAAAAGVEASVMAGLGDPARTGMGRVGMWLNYVVDDPAEVEGRAQAQAAAQQRGVVVEAY